MVIRDLTLRSAASFGSFHLIRLLYDEYMFFLIEHKVAKATGKTPIAVMSEVHISILLITLLHTPLVTFMYVSMRQILCTCISHSTSSEERHGYRV